MIAIDLGIQEVLLFLKGKYFEGKKMEEKGSCMTWTKILNLLTNSSN